jgi:hypothetical protein
MFDMNYIILTIAIIVVFGLIVTLLVMKISSATIKERQHDVAFNCDIYTPFNDKEVYERQYSVTIHYLDNLIQLLESSDYAIKDGTIARFKGNYYIYCTTSIHKDKWIPCNVVLIADKIKFISIKQDVLLKQKP